MKNYIKIESTLRFLIVGLIILGPLSVSAQDGLRQVLEQINANNPTIKAGEQYNTALKLEYRIGISPDDPQVEYGYFPGRSGTDGTKKTLSVSQTIDFPTVYGKKRNIAEEKGIQADHQQNLLRQDVLLDANRTYYELVYLKKREGYLKERVDNTRKLNASLNRKMDSGEATILEINKASVQEVQLQNQLLMVQAEQKQLIERLKWLNNGNTPDIDWFDYHLESLPPTDSIFAEMVILSPAILSQAAEKTIASESLKASKWGWAPQLMVGYESETIPGESFGGPKVGISVPLWTKRNTVKHASARQEYAETQYQNFVQETYFLVLGQRQQVEALQQSVQNFKERLSALHSEELLQKSLNLGQISIIDYFTEINYYISIYDDYLKAERDYYMALAELYKYRL